jgi:heat-inducible transcriptional repressor
MFEQLSDRQRAVLGLVVREYIDSAAPVSSKTVVGQYGLGVSSATIRNEMAFLEDRGFLTHPHTSAGRVPTEGGYRFFVEHLMGEARLSSEDELMIRHQFHQSGLDLEQWAQLAAAVLSRAAHGAALVTSPQVSQCRFKRLDLISIRGSTILLMLVLQEGIVAQRMLSLAQTETEETLNRLANRFNDLFAGSTGDQIGAKVLPMDDL